MHENVLIISKLSRFPIYTIEKWTFKSQFFDKFDKTKIIIKVSYRANILEKWMISYLCLKEGTAKNICFDPHDSSKKYFIKYSVDTKILCAG